MVIGIRELVKKPISRQELGEAARNVLDGNVTKK
jgi:hypothetical protein